MNTLLKIGAVSTLALATAAPAVGQSYRETPESQRAREAYQEQRQDYRRSRENYQEAREDYREARQDYREARREYDRRLAAWERERARYDARHGYGAYARYYARPVWDEAYWSRVGPPAYAGSYGSYASSTSVRCNNNSTVAAGVIGALAGAVLGSNIAGRGDRTEGAVLGALAGGGIGAAVGNANDKYRCDQRGPYFTYDDTVPYRESRRYRYGRYDSSHYARQRCRLAPAPVDSYGRDYRYVRVCPDDLGRYRITG